MTSADWQELSETFRDQLGGEVADRRRLDEIDDAVEQRRLDVTGVREVIDRAGLDGGAARRIVAVWSRLLEQPDVAADAEAVEVATLLARQGEFPASQFRGTPKLAAQLAASRYRARAMPVDAMRDAIEKRLSGEQTSDEASAMRGLREFRHRQLLRVFLREIEGAPLRETTAEIADVAEACLEAALETAAVLEGRADLSQAVCAMGMGKLGGRELNFSSDIDLVFCVDDDVSDGERQRAKKVVRRAVRLMDEVTQRGWVFRVDLRLRPQGSRGQLLPSESALVEYYLNWGRTWERGAWLKARPVAGDRAMGKRILDRLESFLYRRHLDFDAIDELRRMKEMIDEEAQATAFVDRPRKKQSAGEPDRGHSTSPFKARLLKKFDGVDDTETRSSPAENGQSAGADGPRGPCKGWDVKIGKGGIREIEFFVQALQLVHCGVREDLRVRTTLAALDRLLYGGLLSAVEHEQLTGAYDLFRRLEHRLQMEFDRQTHRLPSESSRLVALARRLEMDAGELDASVGEARENVRQIFDRLFSESPQKPEQPTVGDGGDDALERLVGLDPDRLFDESVLARLEAEGFRRPRQVAGQLEVLRRKPHGPFSHSPPGADPRHARYLLRAVCEAPNPEQALGTLVRFTTNVGDTPSTWSMLRDNPHATRLLVHLFGSSAPIGGLLAERPDLFERMVYGGSAVLNRSLDAMQRQLQGELQGVADRARRMGRIRRFHREETVRLALHEIAGAVEVETTCRQLTDLAEVVFRALFCEVVAEYAASHGDPEYTGDPAQTLGLAVVAMGSFGAGEMGFGSDLDFLFVYRPQPSDGGLDSEMATRIAKRVVRALSTAPSGGGGYEVDLRLRPSGRQGRLVVELDAWRDYYRTRAELWERQALIEARPITGDREIRRAVERGRLDLSFHRPLQPEARRKIAKMRRRLAEESAGGGDRFDVKFDPGGTLEVEFLIQWLQLTVDDDELRERRSTFAVLRRLCDLEVDLDIDAAALVDDYAWLRRLECRLAISGVGRVVPGGGPALRSLIRQMGHQGQKASRRFEARLNATRDRIRRATDAVLGDE